jgi:hypothetical protein
MNTVSKDLVLVVARACGHDAVQKFNQNDLSTLKWEIHQLTGIHYAGIQ